ncbi:MAG: M28 family peptidase [bacterium]
MSTTKKKAIYMLALLIAAAPFFMGSGTTEMWGDESPVSENQTLVKILKRLPSVWSLTMKAKMKARDLPDYQGEVRVPDSETIFSWIKGICQWPHRRPGTEEDHAAEKWVRDRFQEIGLQNITMDPVPVTVWDAKNWSLKAGGQTIPSFFVVNTGFTGPEGVTAPLVYVGEGTPADFEEKGVKGKIVVADLPFPYLPSGLLLKYLNAAYTVSDPHGSINLGSGQYLNFVRPNFLGGTTVGTAPPNDVYWNSVKNGAAGICLILKDQPGGTNSHYGPYDGIMKPMPGLWIGKYEGEKLREMAIAGEQATLNLTGIKQPGVMHNVWGVLPGQSDEVILVTSHHDAPFKGAVEDGAGVAQVLAQAWAWSRVPKEQRQKTMVFVVDGGHFYDSKGGHFFARNHPDIMDRTRILITLEHLAAKEVEESGRGYKETGNLALTVMFTSPQEDVVAAVMKSLERKPAAATASIPADFFGPAPTSDASGYVLEAGVPVISWIGCPYYLLDEHDTLEAVLTTSSTSTTPWTRSRSPSSSP